MQHWHQHANLYNRESFSVITNRACIMSSGLIYCNCCEIRTFKEYGTACNASHCTLHECSDPICLTMEKRYAALASKRRSR